MKAREKKKAAADNDAMDIVGSPRMLGFPR
jgi:hypothetical protein